MPSFGITGHMDLDAATREGVRSDLRAYLSRFSQQQLVGISCIAEGADAIFAETVLELGGSLHVVLPSADYRDAKVKPHYRAEFDALISRASAVTVMATTANREAYQAANDSIISNCDTLVAVWDGVLEQKNGGTAGTVESAKASGKPVVRIWRDGFTRTSRNYTPTNQTALA